MGLLRSQVTKGDVHGIIKAIKGGSDHQMIIGRTYTPSGTVNMRGNNRDGYRIVLTSGDEYAMYRDEFKQELLEWYGCDIEYLQNTHFSRAEYEALAKKLGTTNVQKLSDYVYKNLMNAINSDIDKYGSNKSGDAPINEALVKRFLDYVAQIAGYRVYYNDKKRIFGVEDMNKNKHVIYDVISTNNGDGIKLTLSRKVRDKPRDEQALSISLNSDDGEDLFDKGMKTILKELY